MADETRTQFAMQAVGFSELFKAVIGSSRVSGHRIELAKPEGQSTGGGKQAVQHIRLTPEGGGAVIVAGHANPVEKEAELRTYEYLADLHAHRFRGAKIPLDQTEYALLYQKMKSFFESRGLTVKTAAIAPISTDSTKGVTASASSIPTQWILLSFIGIIVLGLIIAALL